MDRFDDVFFVLELMATDLTRVLPSNIELSPEHIRRLVFQLIHGIYYTHTSRVFLSNLKPSSILINTQCGLFIVGCDLSRASVDYNELYPSSTQTASLLSGLRPETHRGRPHQLLHPHRHAVLRLHDRRELNKCLALFMDHNPEDQLQLIVNACGTPSSEAFKSVREAHARAHLASMPKCPRHHMEDLFSTAESLSLDL